jgi:hypothetical protein
MRDGAESKRLEGAQVGLRLLRRTLNIGTILFR